MVIRVIAIRALVIRALVIREPAGSAGCPAELVLAKLADHRAVFVPAMAVPLRRRD
jgi:hypothetical protein